MGVRHPAVSYSLGLLLTPRMGNVQLLPLQISARVIPHAQKTHQFSAIAPFLLSRMCNRPCRPQNTAKHYCKGRRSDAWELSSKA
ncbi:hypothetical protein FH972_023559 [Carpinus fangiana]|uniref:Uncharacterized protein n=1 Tax=Carpinus fangiana TaxID=176857 RepID=A0A5N6KW52_9ROSI|nr:hypothetical protein FH972_023559 [Carpinus fangiana]